MNVEQRLEEKLGELIQLQISCTARMFNPDLSKQIQDLEWVRDRRWIKCIHCGIDLTLELCEHHAHRKGKLYDGSIKNA